MQLLPTLVAIDALFSWVFQRLQRLDRHHLELVRVGDDHVLDFFEILCICILITPKLQTLTLELPIGCPCTLITT
jgi:hypothetical protein